MTSNDCKQLRTALLRKQNNKENKPLSLYRTDSTGKHFVSIKYTVRVHMCVYLEIYRYLKGNFFKHKFTAVGRLYGLFFMLFEKLWTKCSLIRTWTPRVSCPSSTVLASEYAQQLQRAVYSSPIPHLSMQFFTLQQVYQLSYMCTVWPYPRTTYGYMNDWHNYQHLITARAMEATLKKSSPRSPPDSVRSASCDWTKFLSLLTDSSPSFFTLNRNNDWVIATYM